jgi:hypothetical protein
MTQQDIDEMHRLQAEEERARHALDEFDRTHGHLRDWRWRS